MSSPPRRPILKLKTPPPPPVTASRWKCKPCGELVVLTGREPAADDVRCPACNARLGVAADFQDTSGQTRVRARRLADKPG